MTAMKVNGDYYGRGYAHLEGLVPYRVCYEFLAQLKADIDKSGVPMSGRTQAAAILKRPALEIYGAQHKPMLTFLWGLTPTMCDLTGKKLLPTYSYFRAYQNGDVCWVHSDRFACEHSLSLTLMYSEGEPWPLDVGSERLTASKGVETDFGDEPYGSVPMRAGDAVLYQGVHYRHGRITPNPNRWSAHMFLHWVDSEGPYAQFAFDGKASRDPIDFEIA